jgi:hypothetical protein
VGLLVQILDGGRGGLSVLVLWGVGGGWWWLVVVVGDKPSAY